MIKPQDYKYRGARALVLLHERHLREFLETWRAFRSSGLPLQETDDPDYASFESLLRHVLGNPRSYMVWVCEKLKLADPGFMPVPEKDAIEAQASAYLEHLLEKWETPLAGVEEESFHNQVYLSRWGVQYSVEAMLEHAVCHPMRHTLQLRELMQAHR